MAQGKFDQTTRRGFIDGRFTATTIATCVLICSLALSGSSGIFASMLDLPSFEIVMLRSSFGALLLALMMLVKRTPLTVLEHKGEAVLVILAGASLGVDWLLLFEAYVYAGVGLSTVLCYCAPIIAMALAPVLFHERMTLVKVTGFAVVALGAVLINSVAIEGGASVHGIVCGLGSAVCLASMIVLNKKVVHVAGLEKVTIEIAASAAVVILYAFFAKGVTIGGVVAGLRPVDVLPVAALGLTTALCNHLYIKSIAGLTMQRTAILGYVEPLSAVILSALFLGETMAALQLIGVVCIIMGALVAEASPVFSSLRAMERRVFRIG